MRVARYRDDSAVRVAFVEDDRLFPLPPGTDVLRVLNASVAERVEIAASADGPIPLDRAKLVAPLDPRAMRDFVAFEKHVQGVNSTVGGGGENGVPDAWYEAPVFLFMNPYSLTAPFADIPMPPYTEAMDFELEVAAIVGRRCRDVPPDEAESLIVGYAIFNDWSARDIQRREMQVHLGPSKGKDFANTLGPWITTPDELEQRRVGDRYDLAMEVRVNGDLIGGESLATLGWSFPEMLVHASRDAWVGSGDVLATGTVGGGALAEWWSRRGEQTPGPLQVGDVVTMTVEGLGTIENRISETRSPGHRAPGARRLVPEPRRDAARRAGRR